MGAITVEIDDDLDMAFRQKVLITKKNKKGALRGCVEEAMRLWLKEGE